MTKCLASVLLLFLAASSGDAQPVLNIRFDSDDFARHFERVGGGERIDDDRRTRAVGVERDQGVGVGTVEIFQRDGRSVDGNFDRLAHGVAPTVSTAPKLQVRKKPVTGGSETVLLAEDNPDVRNLAVRVLQKGGHPRRLADLHHAPRVARRTQPAALARIGDNEVVAALGTARPCEAVR